MNRPRFLAKHYRGRKIERRKMSRKDFFAFDPSAYLLFVSGLTLDGRSCVMFGRLSNSEPLARTRQARLGPIKPSDESGKSFGEGEAPAEPWRYKLGRSLALPFNEPRSPL